jgi:hypothetical protein
MIYRTDGQLIEALVATPCNSDLRRSARLRGIRRHRYGDVIVITQRRSHARTR